VKASLSGGIPRNLNGSSAFELEVHGFSKLGHKLVGNLYEASD